MNVKTNLKASVEIEISEKDIKRVKKTVVRKIKRFKNKAQKWIKVGRTLNGK